MIVDIRPILNIRIHLIIMCVIIAVRPLQIHSIGKHVPPIIISIVCVRVHSMILTIITHRCIPASSSE